MFPYFMLFGKMIGLYQVLALVGIFVAGIFFCRQLRKAGLDDNDGIVFLLWVGLGVVVGGSLLYAITQNHLFPLLFRVSDFSQLFTVLRLLFGGLVFYGGLIGGCLTGLLVIKLKKLPVRRYMDLSAMFIPLFHCFARIGCFLAGCCYGVECEFGFTVHGNELIPPINGVSRFPVQLLESMGCLLIFFLLWFLYRKEKMEGHLLFVYLGTYAVLRFFDEFLRGDEMRGFVFGISTSQFISILMAAVSVAGLFHWFRSYKKSPKKS